MWTVVVQQDEKAEIRAYGPFTSESEAIKWATKNVPFEAGWICLLMEQVSA